MWGPLPAAAAAAPGRRRAGGGWEEHPPPPSPRAWPPTPVCVCKVCRTVCSPKIVRSQGPVNSGGVATVPGPDCHGWVSASRQAQARVPCTTRTLALCLPWNIPYKDIHRWSACVPQCGLYAPYNGAPTTQCPRDVGVGLASHRYSASPTAPGLSVSLSVCVRPCMCLRHLPM